MLLKIRPVKSLLRHLFRVKERDFLSFLDEAFLKVFSKKDSLLYEIEPKNLLKLNEILFSLKDTFSLELGDAPLPLIFFIFEGEKHLPQGPYFRPGKIYFTKDLKTQIEKAFSGASFFYKILEQEEDFFELLLPSTVPAKLLFDFKEIFFVPHEKPCFFCQSHLHESSKCPSLEIKDALSTFKELLKASLSTIAEKLKEDYEKRLLKESFFDYFYVRYFFLHPSFLKIFYYLEEEVTSWASLGKSLSFPLRGGELFLALEDLIYGRLASAKTRLKELSEEDLKVSLGLMMLSLLEEDFSRSLYYLEKALSQTQNPFLQSYLYLLKGYIYHFQGDFILSEENYRASLKADSSAFPAFYFLQLLNYQGGEPPQKIFPFFQNPFVLYYAFLEPKFIRDEKLLEEELEKSLLRYKEEAINRLKEVEDKYHKLKEMMGEEERREYLEKIKKFQENIYQGGVGLIDETSKRLLEVSLELSNFVLSKQKKLKKDFERILARYRTCEAFWKDYPYKVEDAFFGRELKKAFELLDRVSKRFRRSDLAKEIKFIAQELEKAEKLLLSLLEVKPKLEKKWQFRKKLAKFLLRFSALEGFLVLAYTLPFLVPNLQSLTKYLSLSSFFILSLILFILTLLSVNLEK